MRPYRAYVLVAAELDPAHKAVQCTHAFGQLHRVWPDECAAWAHGGEPLILLQGDRSELAKHMTYPARYLTGWYDWIKTPDDKQLQSIAFLLPSREAKEFGLFKLARFG